MVCVSRLNGKAFFINPHLVEFIEETPDTVITLTNGKKIVVEETASLVVERIIDYRMQISAGLPKHVNASETR